jgi:hypothetical protein
MRTILKFTILTILAVLFLTPVFVSAQEKTDPGSAKPRKTDDSITVKIPPAAKQTEEKTSGATNEGIEFPEIKDWERDSITTFPDPALGYSIGYESDEGGRVTIYVYNGGLKKIPQDINEKVIKEEIERAKNEIIQIGKMGIYQGVKELKNDTVTLGGASGKVKALRSLFYFKVKGEEVDSEIYLFSYKNNFIKIRSTRPKSEKGTENKAILNLLAELDKIFAD